MYSVLTGRPAKVVVACTVILALAMTLFLLHRPISVHDQAKACVVDLRLTSYASLRLNCDTSEMMRLGSDPGALFDGKNERLSRPLFILGAFVLSKALTPAASLLQSLVPADTGQNGLDPNTLTSGKRTMVTVYVAYLAINVALLVGSAIVLVLTTPACMLRYRATIVSLLLGSVLLFCNDVTKAFVWSPHFQMLNIFVPICAYSILLRPQTGRSRYLFSMVAGVGLLAYGNTPIILGAVLIGLGMPRAAAGQPILAWRVRLQQALLCLALFAAPSVIWSLILRATVGPYDVAEVSKYHQVVWIIEAWRIGAAELASTAWVKTSFFVQAAFLGAVPALLLSMFTAIRVASSGVLPAWWRSVSRFAWPALAISALSVGFYVVVGWPAARLAFAAVPSLIAFACMAISYGGRTLPGGWRPADGLALAACTVGWVAFVVMKDGPWA